MSSPAAETLSRPAPAFLPGRESIWTSESPLVADGTLQDLHQKAQERVLEALTDLMDARKASAGFTDGHLAGAERDLRTAMSLIADLRQRLGAVPAGWGR